MMKRRDEKRTRRGERGEGERGEGERGRGGEEERASGGDGGRRRRQGKEREEREVREGREGGEERGRWMRDERGRDHTLNHNRMWGGHSWTATLSVICYRGREKGETGRRREGAVAV